MRPSCTPSAVERAYLAATRGAVLLPLAACGAAQVQHAPHGVRLTLRAAAHLPLSSVHLTADQARARRRPARRPAPGDRVMPAPLTLPPAAPLPPLVSVPALPEVAAAKALRRSLDHQQVYSLYARAVAAVEAARTVVVEAGNIATAEAAAPGREGHYYAALADVLDDLDMALLHAVEALPSEDALWDRAADAEGAP